jgi:hypothetical protein
VSVAVKSQAGGLIVAEIGGLLQYAEFAELQAVIRNAISQSGKIRLLIRLTNFTGMEKSEAWGEVGLPGELDQYIEKIAIIGDPQWRETAFLFTAKNLRSFPIEYFLRPEENHAQRWIKDPT